MQGYFCQGYTEHWPWPASVTSIAKPSLQQCNKTADHVKWFDLCW